MRALSLLCLFVGNSLAQTANLPTALGIQPGMTVVQIGLRGDIDLNALSDAVGPKGKVIVPILHGDLIDWPVSSRPNVYFTRGTPDDPKLAVASIDVLLVEDFSSMYQRSPSLLAFFRSALKPLGTFFVGETFKWWDEDAYEQQIEAAGFDILKRFEHSGLRWMSFRRP